MRDPVVDEGEFEPFDALLGEVVEELAPRNAALSAALGRHADREPADGPGETPRRRTRLFAAALLLLGIGAVFGVLLERRGGEESHAAGQRLPQQVPAPPPADGGMLEQRLDLDTGWPLSDVAGLPGEQDPPRAQEPHGERARTGDAQGPLPPPKNLEEWRSLLPRVRRVSICLAPIDSPTARGEASTVDGNGVLEIVDPQQVDAWRRALLAPIEPAAQRGRAWWGWQGSLQVLHLRLLLDDQQVVVAFGIPTRRPMIQFGNHCVELQTTDPLAGLLYLADAKVRANVRMGRGEAEDLDDLRRLPANVRQVRCWCVDTTEAAELRRFTAIERLVIEPRSSTVWGVGLGKATPGGGAQASIEFSKSQFLDPDPLPQLGSSNLPDAGGTAPQAKGSSHTFSVSRPSPPHGAVVATIATLATLRTLSLPGTALDAGDLQQLAKLPQLQELELSVGDPAVLVAALPLFATRLQVLRVRVQMRPPLELGPLHPLVAQYRAKAEAAIEALAVACLRLPKLRQLDLGGSSAVGDRAVDWLALTKLECLQLDATPVAGKQIAKLAELPSLRELSLRGTQLGDDDLDSLQKLRVRRLDLTGARLSAAGLDALRVALPLCDVQARADAGSAPGVFFDDGQDGRYLRLLAAPWPGDASTAPGQPR